MNTKQVVSEIAYKAVRSSGPGGQHANKVATKVVLVFSIKLSKAFTESEKHKLTKYFNKKISSDGLVTLSADSSRSQLQNKKLVTQRFLDQIEKALWVKKLRKKSKPSRSSLLKAQKSKKMLSEKKNRRQKPKNNFD